MILHQKIIKAGDASYYRLLFQIPFFGLEVSDHKALRLLINYVLPLTYTIFNLQTRLESRDIFCSGTSQYI